MKLAISNIAWDPSENESVAELMKALGVRYVEIAPTTIDSSPIDLEESDLVRYRSFWSDYGIRIIAMQALLYGRKDLVIFGGEEKRKETIAYLRRMIDIAAFLGAESLVFGSPGNRFVGDTPPDEVARIEQSFFGAIGEIAHEAGVRFCIEPNPVEYGCDYLNTSAEVSEFLSRVDSPGLGLHLDAAGMTMAGETPEALRDLAPGSIRHFHISEPQLALIGTGGVDHGGFGEKLRQKGYDRFVSIEMRKGEPGGEPNLERVSRALETARSAYDPSE